MSIIVTFLLQDHEGRNLKKATLDIRHKDKVYNVHWPIKSMWFIRKRCQKFFYNGNEMNCSSTFEEIGVQDHYEIILKHSLLPKWITCQEIAENLKQAESEDMKFELAKQGSEILCLLEENRFIITYPHFINKYMEIIEVFDPYVMGAEECAKLATSEYFKNYHKKDALEIGFCPKSKRGNQGGFVCKIEDKDEFFVKSHTSIEYLRSFDSRPDPREIFAYHLLHLIGVGPEPHFIRCVYPKFYTPALVLHIATKRIPGFKMHADLSPCDFTLHHQLQLNTLKCLLYLASLHEFNYGLDEKEQLFIVDFIIADPGCRINYLSRVNYLIKKDQREECKEILTKWNIRENFEKAKSVAKTDLDRLESLDWKDDDYETYLEAVEKTIDSMMTVS